MSGTVGGNPWIGRCGVGRNHKAVASAVRDKLKAYRLAQRTQNPNALF